MLGVDARALDAERGERRTHLLDHVARSAHEILSDFTGCEQRPGELAHPRPIETPVVERHLLGFAAHQEMQRQLLEVAVFERQQLLEAHRPRAVAVAIKENHPGTRPGEQRAHHREHRRDAATGGERHVGCALRRAARCEAAVRRQDLESIAAAQVLGEMPRHAPRGVHPWNDAQRPFSGRVHQ
jgi:hypothetical protein